MIEAGRFPGGGRVADDAIGRKCREHMLGAQDGIVVCLMAGVALDRRPLIAIHVALAARFCRMSASNGIVSCMVKR